jgi:hypothetical protein
MTAKKKSAKKKSVKKKATHVVKKKSQMKGKGGPIHGFGSAIRKK